MRYQRDLDIDAPRDTVLALFLEPDNLTVWQPDLVSFEHVSGEGPRDLGAVTRQVHRMGKREVEMTETITVNDPPENFAAIYEADGIWNLVENRFTETDAGRTHWALTSECRGTGFMVKLMLLLAPGMFRRQTDDLMHRFKAFVESQSAE